MDDDDTLPPHHVLEALTVPELPFDFTDRVMGTLQPAAPAPSLLPRRSGTPWIIAAASSAVALAAMLVLWRAPVPAPLPVAAPDAAPPSLGVTAPLPAAPARAHLVLTVDPHDAIVRVDGEPLGGPSPFIATNLAPGSHTITVDHVGFIPWTRTLDVPQGELDLPIELEPAVAPEVGAAIETPTTKPGPSKPASRPTKSKNPFSDYADNFDDTSSDLQDPFAPKPATLVFIWKGPGGPKNLRIDGRKPRIASSGWARVKPGSHKLSYTSPSGELRLDHVDVRPGETKLMPLRGD